jgi:hydroxyacylglutathione hydrolase
MIRVGGLSLEILHTPGHTPGSISIACDGALYTGDLILPHDVEDMGLEEADEAVRNRSVREVVGPRAKDGGVTIHPGHGESFPFGPVER